MGPSSTMGATIPVSRRPATKVVVFQWPFGMPAQALALRRTSTQAGHVGGRACLVNEDQPFGIELELVLEPRLAPLQDVGPVLLGGVGGLF